VQRDYDDSAIRMTELDVAATLAGAFNSGFGKDPDGVCS
jgi:hypothetical protein